MGTTYVKSNMILRETDEMQGTNTYYQKNSRKQNIYTNATQV